jgi:hypothetical protein
MELKSGDVVVLRRAGSRVCKVGLVTEDGKPPIEWHTAPVSAALVHALSLQATTKGRIHDQDETEWPFTT